MDEELETLDTLDTIDEESEVSKPTIEIEEVEKKEDDNKYNCELCAWKPAEFCKDKERALKNHYKNKHPEYYRANFATRNRKSTKTEKISIIENTNNVIEEVKQSVNPLSEEEQRLQLLQDLDCFKLKFKDLNYEWKYNNDSSLEFLKREKSLFLRIIQEEVGTRAIFNLLVVGAKSAERICDSLGVVDIDGYSGDVANNKDEILTILKDMVDSGLISATALTPEMRLAMIMVSLGVNRAEINKIEKGKSKNDV